MKTTRRIRTWIRAACWLALLTPIVVTSTPPEPPPWHAFGVSGYLVSGSGGSVANYSVVLMGEFDSGWRILHSCSPERAEEWGGTRDIFLTDHWGRYYLSVWNCSAPDSIAPAVVLPDTILFGPRIARRSLGNFRYDRTYEIEEDGFLCDDEHDVTVVDGYMYDNLDSLKVMVP
jgi:hypothetical protein